MTQVHPAASEQVVLRGFFMPTTHRMICCRSRNYGILKNTLLSVSNSCFNEAGVPTRTHQSGSCSGTKRKREKGGTASPVSRCSQHPSTSRALPPLADAGWRPPYEQLTQGEQVGDTFPE